MARQQHPVYTKPLTWRGLDVPEVLLSGHHARVARFRRDEALRRTALRRPDLLRKIDPDRFDDHDLAVLDSLGFHLEPPSVAD